MMTGIPVQKVAEKESGKLMKMVDSMNGTVIGQNEAITKVVKAIQRNRALKDLTNQLDHLFFLVPQGWKHSYVKF